MIKGYKDTKPSKTVTLGFSGESAPQPTLYLTDKDLPELKTWDIGKTYNLEITVKLISRSEREYDGKKEMTGSFDVTNITVDNDNDDQEED